MDMKKVRDLARKENKAQKSNAKGKAKAVKALAATAVDNVLAASNAVSKKGAEVKASIAETVHTAQADTKAGIKKMAQINQGIASGAGKIANDIKHTGHDVAERIKRH